MKQTAPSCHSDHLQVSDLDPELPSMHACPSTAGVCLHRGVQVMLGSLHQDRASAHVEMAFCTSTASITPTTRRCSSSFCRNIHIVPEVVLFCTVTARAKDRID